MFNRFKYIFFSKKYRDRTKEIDPDEVFIDSENLPKFDVYQFEGRIEKPISHNTFVFLTIFCFLLFGSFFFKAWLLQIKNGGENFDKSENNRLRHTLIFTKRGVISDRNGENLAWNVYDENNPEFSLRKYNSTDGLSHVIGYIKYPSKDKYGFYYNEDFVGKDGVEKFYNETLTGSNGLKIIEVDAHNKVQSENMIRPAKDGVDIKLSIDSKVQEKMYKEISGLAERVGFTGGAGVMMDVNTGEILSLVSYPEYSSQIMTDGSNVSKINSYLRDKNTPLLNRVTYGLYTPGSILKPFMAISALIEKIIDPYKNILSTGSISIPNRYNPESPTVFKDWKEHGYVDMRKAIAVSSDVYFYSIGGGYQDQKGLGINLIDKYMIEFGFGKDIPEGFLSGTSGVIPTPEWKKENFNGEDWTIGNTYHTSIGQYGFQVTPIQTVRSIASIVNGGKLLNPSIILGGNKDDFIKLQFFNEEYFRVAKEGMKMTVEEGTAIGLKSDFMTLGAKTGTAELGSKKQFVNSWVVGFFPYENPKYAFAVIMEKGPITNTLGGVYVMRQVFDWMNIYARKYLN
jgi:penicillin-binding protein 2